MYTTFEILDIDTPPFSIARTMHQINNCLENLGTIQTSIQQRLKRRTTTGHHGTGSKKMESDADANVIRTTRMWRVLEEAVYRSG